MSGGVVSLVLLESRVVEFCGAKGQCVCVSEVEVLIHFRCLFGLLMMVLVLLLLGTNRFSAAAWCGAVSGKGFTTGGAL